MKFPHLERYSRFSLRRRLSAAIAVAMLWLGWMPPAKSADQPIPSPAQAAVTNEDWGDPNTMDRAAVIERTMRPYTGPSHAGVDASTLTGKVMCGYQGWFAAKGDGVGRDWFHWSMNNRFEPH